MYVALGILDPFHVAEINGVTFRVANDGFRSAFSGWLVGWQVRSTQLFGLGQQADAIERERTEIVKMTPYIESTGPRDPGNGFRWVDRRRQLGRGIIVIPPAGWKPEDDLMRATKGELVAIATEDFAQVPRLDRDEPGFVLVEPAEGWKNVGGLSVEPGSGEVPSTRSLLIAAGVTVGVAAVVYLLWGRR